MSNFKRVTATGDAIAGDVYLKSVNLEGGSAASSAEIRDGSGGGILLKLLAAANASVSWTSGDKRGVSFGTAVHVTLAGTGAAATAEVE